MSNLGRTGWFHWPAPGPAMLWILAGGSVVLLVFELNTVVRGVLWPLLNNPQAIQTDFQYYYDAALRFSEDPDRLYLASDDFIAGFAYPPLAILPFLPLSRLPLGTALLYFTLASYSALLIAVWLWCGRLRARGVSIDPGATAALTVIALALGPTYLNATFGQVNTFVLLSCVGFLGLFDRLPIAAGALLACGTWLKVYPILMMAIGTWNRRAWRAIAYAGVAVIVLMVITLPIVPLSAHRAFVQDVLPARVDKTAIHFLNQSLVAFVERFQAAPLSYLEWNGEETVTVSATMRTVNWGVTLLVLIFLRRRATSGSALASVASEAGVMALVAIVAPLGWGHTYVLALPLVVLRLSMARQMGPGYAFIVFCCVGAMMVPAGYRFSFADHWPHWLQNLAYSRYLLATTVLILYPTRAHWR